VDVEESAPVDVLPDVARLPLHAPEAVQEVAPLELHVRVDALPAFTDVGFADRLTVGGEGGVVGFTVTVTDLAVEPPLFAHVRVYVEVVVRAPVDALPEVVRLPLQAPEAVQDVAPLDDHESVEALPEFTDVGFAERLTVGGDGGGVWLTVTVTDLAVEPPAFEQVSV
jgi:hypothetical protein